MSEEVKKYKPAQKLTLNKKLFLKTLQKKERGSAASLTGLRFEHVRMCLDNEESTDLLYAMAQKVVRAEMPQKAATMPCIGRLIALQKLDNGV